MGKVHKIGMDVEIKNYRWKQYNGLQARITGFTKDRILVKITSDHTVYDKYNLKDTELVVRGANLKRLESYGKSNDVLAIRIIKNRKKFLAKNKIQDWTDTDTIYCMKKYLSASSL